MGLTLSVDETKLVDHVRRVCRRNLRVPAKCCQKCPFLLPVMEVMFENEWYYHDEIWTVYQNLKK